MHNELLISISGVLHNLTLTPSHTALTVAFVLLAVIGLITVKIDAYMENNAYPYITGIVLIAVAALEVFCILKGGIESPKWIVSSWGNFAFGMVVWLAALAMMYTQYLLLTDCLSELSDYGGYNSRFGLGFRVLGVFAVLLVVAALFGSARYGNKPMIAVAVAFGAVQLYVVGYALVSALRNGGIVQALCSVVLYLVTLVGLGSLFVRFILPGMLWFVFLWLGRRFEGFETTGSISSQKEDVLIHRNIWGEWKDNQGNSYKQKSDGSFYRN